jgi:hypothetical protein
LQLECSIQAQLLESRQRLDFGFSAIVNWLAKTLWIFSKNLQEFGVYHERVALQFP